MTVPEYLELKKNCEQIKMRVSSGIKSIELKQKYLDEIESFKIQISDAEMSPDIISYKRLKKTLGDIKRDIAIRKRRNGPITDLQARLEKTQLKLAQMESGESVATQEYIELEHTNNTSIQESNPLPINSNSIYYIINLSWTDISEDLQNPIVEFMNMTNFMSFHESSHTFSWKFAYDTVEEKAQAKSLQICASHLLTVMKKNIKCQSDAEVYGKQQKY